MTTHSDIKVWFKRLSYPTQEQFYAWIDACILRGDEITIADIKSLQTILDNKVNIGEITIDDVAELKTIINNIQANLEVIDGGLF